MRGDRYTVINISLNESGCEVTFAENTDVKKSVSQIRTLIMTTKVAEEQIAKVHHELEFLVQIALDELRAPPEQISMPQELLHREGQ